MIVFLIVLAVVVAIAMAATALVVAIAGSWFLHVPFADGWEAAWDKPWVLLGFALIVGIIFGSSRD